MAARHWSSRLTRISVAAFALAAASWLAGPVAAAAELDKLDTSLKLIPDDAAFYSCTLRNREQFEAIRHSNAWAKVWEMPVVQMGVSLYQMQQNTPGSRVAQIDAVLKKPEVRKIADLLADMVSDDMFIYGDDSCIDFVKLMQEVGGAAQYGPMVLEATGKAEGYSFYQLKAKLAVSALAEHADLIEVPNVVLGFKLQSVDLAKDTAEMSRRHNDSNVLCLSADLLGERLIDRMIEIWLNTPFEGGRHARRVDKITALEREAEGEMTKHE